MSQKWVLFLQGAEKHRFMITLGSPLCLMPDNIVKCSNTIFLVLLYSHFLFPTNDSGLPVCVVRIIHSTLITWTDHFPANSYVTTRRDTCSNHRIWCGRPLPCFRNASPRYLPSGENNWMHSFALSQTKICPRLSVATPHAFITFSVPGILPILFHWSSPVYSL